MGRINMFSLDDDQAEKVQEWKQEHECSLRTDEHGVRGERYVGAIGGATTYSFTPTGIGTIVEVTCACGSKIDVTDNNW